MSNQISEDQAYIDGQDAWATGQRVNPISPMSNPIAYDSWWAGWLDARDNTRLPTGEIPVVR